MSINNKKCSKKKKKKKYLLNTEDRKINKNNIFLSGNHKNPL